LLLLAVWGCRETHESHHPTYAAAEQAGAIAMGTWIPRWTPTGAKDIREVHNIDTNACLLAYSVEGGDPIGSTKACSPVQERDVRLPRWVPVAWWPDALRGGTPTGGRWKFFACNEQGSGRNLVAVDGVRVFVWNTHSR
jgi:hypothetical protein